MLIINTQIPYKYNAKGQSRRITLNSILTMTWKPRKVIHDQLLEIYTTYLWGLNLPKIDPGTQLKIAFGFSRDSSTGNLDLDNFAYVAKVFIDALASVTGINDNFKKIIEIRYAYLGEADDEHLRVIVETTEDKFIKPRKSI